MAPCELRAFDPFFTFRVTEKEANIPAEKEEGLVKRFVPTTLAAQT